VAYLRFTPQEYRALCRARRVVDLRTDDPNFFQVSLLFALADDWPRLAERVAGLLPSQLIVLRNHLRALTGDVGPGPGQDFTPAELEALAQARGTGLATVRPIGPFRDVLVRHFEKVSPVLAKKLAGLSGPQLERLWEEVRRRGRPGT